MTDTSDDHSVFGSDLPDTEFAERVLEISSEVGALEVEVVEYLADGPSPEAYLAWAKANFPDLAPAFFKASEKPRDKVACWLARKFWGMMPVEANGFEPLPMPTDSGAPFPCGSGRGFDACCGDFSVDLPFLSDSLWPVLVESQPSSHWLGLARSGALPDEGKGR